MRLLLAVLVLLAAWTLAACSDREEQGFTQTATLTEPTPTAEASPTAAATTLPTPPVTGIESLDAAIAAIHREDAAELLSQMRMTSLPCVGERFGLAPDPPCNGQPEGKLVEAFPISNCEGSFVPRDVAEPSVRGFAVGERPPSIYAVYDFSGTRLDSVIYAQAEAEYILIAQRLIDGQPFASALLLTDDGIVGSVGGCQQSPTQAVETWELTDAILPPPEGR